MTKLQYECVIAESRLATRGLRFRGRRQIALASPWDGPENQVVDLSTVWTNLG